MSRYCPGLSSPFGRSARVACVPLSQSRLWGKWTKDTRPHEAWDNMSGAPVQDLYRYDLTYATFALALMADVTPAWREGYSAILSFLNDRMLEYWSFVDWVDQKGQD